MKLEKLLSYDWLWIILFGVLVVSSLMYLEYKQYVPYQSEKNFIEGERLWKF